MKKFVLTLGLTFILLGWGWPGYLSGTAPAFGQPYPPPPPPPGYCDPNYYNCNYYNYYSAPYANPLDQFFYYTVPEIGGAIIEQHERHEYREQDRGEHRGFERGHEGGHERH